jgi:RNA polymerase sigma factor (sigma-70 family)
MTLADQARDTGEQLEQAQVREQALAAERALIAEGQAADDPSLIGEAFAMHRPNLVRYMYRQTEGDRFAAEDAVQEAYVKGLEHRQSFIDQGKGSASFLFTVAHNCFINTTRKGGKKQVISLDEAQEGDLKGSAYYQASAEESLIASEEAETAQAVVDHLVSALKGTNREVFIDYFIKRMSYKDLISAYDVPRSAVETRIYRAKVAAKEALLCLGIESWPPNN